MQKSLCFWRIKKSHGVEGVMLGPPSHLTKTTHRHIPKIRCSLAPGELSGGCCFHNPLDAWVQFFPCAWEPESDAVVNLLRTMRVWGPTPSRACKRWQWREFVRSGWRPWFSLPPWRSFLAFLFFIFCASTQLSPEVNVCVIFFRFTSEAILHVWESWKFFFGLKLLISGEVVPAHALVWRRRRFFSAIWGVRDCKVGVWGGWTIYLRLLHLGIGDG